MADAALFWNRYFDAVISDTIHDLRKLGMRYMLAI
jgi:hypothetical protein